MEAREREEEANVNYILWKGQEEVELESDGATSRRYTRTLYENKK